MAEMEKHLLPLPSSILCILTPYVHMATLPYCILRFCFALYAVLACLNQWDYNWKRGCSICFMLACTICYFSKHDSICLCLYIDPTDG
jgi:hypothetical protein